MKLKNKSFLFDGFVLVCVTFANIMADRRTQQKKHDNDNDDNRFRESALAVIIIFLILVVAGLGVAAYITTHNQLSQSQQLIQTLQSRTLQLEMETMELMMTQNQTFQVRYMQNGTVEFGAMLNPTSSAFDVAEYADHVTLNYQLKEVLLAPASIPIHVLEISATPRPVQFTGFVPPLMVPIQNNLVMQFGIWSPPINQLDSLSQNFNYLAYSYITASKIVISPDCPTLGTCTPPSGVSPRLLSDSPTNNAFYIFPAAPGTGDSGFATLQFLYGQLQYTSLPTQYDFTGSQVQLTDSIQLILPIL